MTGNLLPHYSVHEEHHLTIHSDMTAVVTAMANPESGLEVRDRMWLKITIANAFIGSDVVDWLHRNVEGFTDRREARKYAGNLLKAGYIRHTVSKVTFSEQCYYVFGDLCADLAVMSLPDDQEAGGRHGGGDDDPLAPPSGLQWPYHFPVPHPYGSAPPVQQLLAEGGGVSEGSGSAGSHCSDQQGEAAGSQSEPSKREAGAPGEQQQQQLMEEELPGEDGAPRRPSGPPTDLHPQVDPQDDIPAASSLSRGQRRDLAAARQSFRLAVGNPGDFFVDVM